MYGAWKRTPRPVLFLVVTLTLALLLSACGTKTPEPTEPEGSTPPPAATGPQKGGTLVLAKDTEIDTYDPQKTGSIPVASVAQLIGDGLVALEYDLKTIVPALAKEWTVTPDGLTYTFKLREDVLFHSGRKFTSADVLYTFNRLLDPKTASTHAGRLGKVDKMEAPDETTFVLKLQVPSSELLVQLANPFMVILDREAVEKYGDKYGSQYLAGTGPFMFVEWVPNSHMKFKRFDSYTWGPEFLKNKGPAYVDEIIYRVVPERQTLMMELESGEIHSLHGLYPAYVEQLKQNDKVQLIPSEPYLHMEYMGMKVTRPILQDVKVREAINYAINKDEMIDVHLKGLGKPAYSIVNPAASGYWQGSEGAWPKYDAAKAKSLLDEAGWKVGSDGIRVKDGQRMELVYIAYSGREDLATLLQAQLKAVGIDVKVEQMDATAFWPRTREENYDLYIIDYSYPTALDLIGLYFPSTQRPAPNRMGWNDSRTDELINAARVATTAAAKQAALDEIQQIVAKNFVWVPMWHREQYIAASTAMKDFTPHNFYNMHWFKLTDVWLDTTN